MANDNQLELVREGAQVWNDWRRNNLNANIDLSGADLKGVNLSSFDLHEANIREACLFEADLTGAICSGANLCRSDMRRSTLIDADFNEAKLSEADLREVNLVFAHFDRRNQNSQNATYIEQDLFVEKFFQRKFASATLTNLENADLCGAQLQGANLRGATLQGATLQGANLSGRGDFTTNLYGANLSKADLSGANLSDCILKGADLNNTNLTGAELVYTDLSEAHLLGTLLNNANLSNACLQYCTLVEANIDAANFNDSYIYGISTWALKGTPKSQLNLRITPFRTKNIFHRFFPKKASPPAPGEITVDNLQVAQFIYLLLNRENLRDVINTITSKAVLILGRFTLERKLVLNAIADELRKYNLLPIIFDFERPTSRDFTETIKTLAGISLFIIADITNPKSSPLELQATVPDYQIPFLPIIQAGEEPFSMLNDLIGQHDWVLQPVQYSSLEQLLLGFKKAIIDRAWRKHQELLRRKTATIETLSFDDFSQNSFSK